MRLRMRSWYLGSILAIAVGIAGCGQADSPDDAAPPPQSPAEAATTDPSDTAQEPVQTYDGQCDTYVPLQARDFEEVMGSTFVLALAVNGDPATCEFHSADYTGQVSYASDPDGELWETQSSMLRANDAVEITELDVDEAFSLYPHSQSERSVSFTKNGNILNIALSSNGEFDDVLELARRAAARM